IDEPFPSLFNQGMLHGADGFVMSKSRGNVINPIEMIDKYSADILRFYLVSVASPDKDFAWSDEGIDGTAKFIRKVVDYFETVKKGKSSEKSESKINSGIKEISGAIEKFEYNIAVIKIRRLLESLQPEESRETLESFIRLFAPFCPHIAEELFAELGNKGFVSNSGWPKADEKKINPKFEEEEKALDKLVEDINNVVKMVKSKGLQPKKVFLYCIPPEKNVLQENLPSIALKTGLEAKAFAVNDKEKYDPQNKAGKAKPLKPAIFLE
ncbi:MAG: class I tRNA ligase family protein, partial [Candidatus ainarchaeum sp.]|nr:class I tRNA ligase family protein [Candidatus ainarchaeum sp.]